MSALLLACICALSGVGIGGAAPFVSEFDQEVELVEAVEIRPVESSLDAPSFANPGDFLPSSGPGWSDFFWSGSGDRDPDSGMTYWVTTTIYRTTVITLVNNSTTRISTSEVTSSTLTSTSVDQLITLWPDQPSVDCTTSMIEPTPTFASESTSKWPQEATSTSPSADASASASVTVSGAALTTPEATTPLTPLHSAATPSTTSSPTRSAAATVATTTAATRRETPPPPQFWIRAVVQTTSDERSAEFRQRIEDRLRGLYRSRRDLFADSGDIFVRVHNVSRAAGDVHVLYAVSRGTPRNWIDPSVAARFQMSGDSVNGKICKNPESGLNDLCYNIVTPAEPYVLEEVDPAKTAAFYRIVGAILGAVLLILVLAVISYFIIRRNRKTETYPSPGHTTEPPARVSWVVEGAVSQTQAHEVTKADVEGQTSPALPIEDYWLRKSRSTSRKHGRRKRHHHRPQTAPELKPKRSRSSSSLSTSRSPSSGEGKEYTPSREEPSHPSRSCRNLKKKDKDKKLKRKKKRPPDTPNVSSSPDCNRSMEACNNNTTGAKNIHQLSVTHLDLVEVATGAVDQVIQVPEESICVTVETQTEAIECPVPKPRSRRPPVRETEVQEVSTDFTDQAEVVDDEFEPLGADAQEEPAGESDEREDKKSSSSSGVEANAQSEVTFVTPPEKIRWRPGSLIPPRLTSAIFGSRRIASAPTRCGSLRERGPVKLAEMRMSSLEPTPLQDVKRKAWRSSELTLDGQPDTAKKVELLPGRAVQQSPPPQQQEQQQEQQQQPQQQPRIQPPRLHVHSSSVPNWAHLSETDPAIDLIRAIKEELKKFDPPPHQ